MLQKKRERERDPWLRAGGPVRFPFQTPASSWAQRDRISAPGDLRGSGEWKHSLSASEDRALSYLYYSFSYPTVCQTQGTPERIRHSPQVAPGMKINQTVT